MVSENPGAESSGAEGWGHDLRNCEANLKEHVAGGPVAGGPGTGVCAKYVTRLEEEEW